MILYTSYCSVAFYDSKLSTLSTSSLENLTLHRIFGYFLIAIVGYVTFVKICNLFYTHLHPEIFFIYLLRELYRGNLEKEQEKDFANLWPLQN